MSRDDDATTMPPETRTVTEAVTVPPGAPHTPRGSSGRFHTGDIVAGRYRLVTLLGKGGMGEVYRAEDLTLDQPVALKFLPENVGQDSAALAQLHNELKTARQVSHKNVCRLYDLGEANGRRFITMEYVDGEDLATLIRRIGRLPEDKAVEIGRQLCAGLAAAHARGVLHRDLKPANVMLDGDGNVRITDFGLAVGEQDAASASHAGTPQYMAPEQLRGEPASVKTDIYALGLVLFEVFTGKRALQAKTLDELRELHVSGSITTPTSLVRDLDPAVERVILRCLDRDPAARPPSALAVAAALPGGDPLAEALAAGETPSPALIAAAGRTDAIRPALGLSLLALCCIGVLILGAAYDRISMIARTPLERPLDVLEDRASEMVKQFGYTDPPADTARGLLNYNDYVAYIRRTKTGPDRWDTLSTGDFPTIRFWYRTSPRELISDERFGPFLEDPPLAVTNMTSTVLDPRGRLTQFMAVPPQVDEVAPATAMNWEPLFAAAGLPRDRFEPISPLWMPLSFADERAAWQGPMPNHPDIQLRVEGAGYRGRPVFFRVIGPWTTPTRPPSVRPPLPLTVRILTTVSAIASVSITLISIVLARQNVRRGRSDWSGATRLFFFIIATWIAAWLFGARHFPNPGIEQTLFFNRHVPFALLNAGFVWVLYLAVEPYIRRYGPETLFSWTRALSGRWRDARLGRDVLIGVLAGVIHRLVNISFFPLTWLVGDPPLQPLPADVLFVAGSGSALLRVLTVIPNAIQNAAIAVMIYVVVRAVTRRHWIAAVSTIVVWVLLFGLEGAALRQSINLPVSAITAGIAFVTLMRFGLLPLIVLQFVQLLLGRAPLTLDLSASHFRAGAAAMLIVIGLAAYGYYAARGREGLFGDATS